MIEFKVCRYPFYDGVYEQTTMSDDINRYVSNGWKIHNETATRYYHVVTFSKLKA